MAMDKWWKAPVEPPHTRPVPEASGEAAIYSPEYLERVEGNRRGTDPTLWRKFYVPEGLREL